MTVAMYLPVAAVVGLVLAAVVAWRRPGPRFAAVLLLAAEVAAAVAAGAAALAVAVGRLAAVPAVASRIGWCTDHVGSLGAGLAVAGLVGAVAGAGALAVRAARASRVAPPESSSPIVVVDAPSRHAIAMPGHGGRIVVTTGLLAALEPEERAAVFAHELAHLRHRHDRYLRAGAIASAALPVLRPVQRRLQLSLERWADEVAAADIGSRALLARALAKVAIGPALAPGVLGIGAGDVVARLVALSAPPRRSRRADAASAVAAAALLGLAALQVQHLGAMLFAC